MKRAVAILILLGCSAAPEEVFTPERRGEALVDDPRFTSSSFNPFQCTHCHSKTEAGEKLPGGPLAGAAKRPSFWNGRFYTLFEAVDFCQRQFMRGLPLDPKAPKTLDLYAYLVSIGDKGPTTARKFELILEVKDLPRGDATRGNGVWVGSCQSCHGAPHTGAGRLKPLQGDNPISIVPEETIKVHGKEGPNVVREAVIEKIRHGGFLEFAGVMAPFTPAQLSDTEVADVVTFLGLYDLK